MGRLRNHRLESWEVERDESEIDRRVTRETETVK